MMKLADKGPIVKPPVLKGPAQKVSRAIQSWDGIVAATHWTIGDSTRVNGADFYVGEKELGHIHLDGEMHLLLTPSLARLVLAAEIAEFFPWGEAWVQLSIADARSATRALALFELGYARLRGVAMAELKAKIV